jgi:hypothetical protein
MARLYLCAQNICVSWHTCISGAKRTGMSWHKCITGAKRTGVSWHKCITGAKSTGVSWHKCITGAKVRVCHGTNASLVPKVRVCHGTNASLVPKVRVCHGTNASLVPNVRVYHGTRASRSIVYATNVSTCSASKPVSNYSRLCTKEYFQMSVRPCSAHLTLSLSSCVRQRQFQKGETGRVRQVREKGNKICTLCLNNLV